jgi:hypothetical protein
MALLSFVESAPRGERMDVVVCPACRGINWGACQRLPANFDRGTFECEMCGPFDVSGTAMAKLMAPEDRLSAIQRAALPHRIRSSDDAGGIRPFIRTDWLDKFLDDARLPTHFDTNHCTTVPWSANEQGEFTKQLIATLRRSLNLFPKR